MSTHEFGYVVVGGGTAGNVVAARLSEEPSVTVCVLEAGPSDVGDDDVLRLERWMGLLESGYDWDYPVEPQASGNSFMRHARAKVLGGCSSHNSCIAFWAPAEDLDDWAAAGCTSWSAADLFPLYRHVTRAKSRGTIRLRTRDYRDKPRVDPRYFTHEHDVRVMTYGLRLARRIAEQPALSGWAGAELAPGPDVRTDGERLDYIHTTHNTMYHPSCTVKMGADDDPSAPLDARLRVKGEEGLRVADGSVMPDLVTVNPCITTMMIGEKCAELLRGAA
ncbi:GMC oxidoreductase [Streptomyces violaceus]|uniref:GMC oxidoreductase n=1 Tax=Streptomyces violaceus TaxID=1936 RepID=A0ABZ1NNC6_STRVL|nr:GMC oxidoreductase [Streptomyces violaceus]